MSHGKWSGGGDALRPGANETAAESRSPSSDDSSGTALVLGGGGPTGAAWMAGVLAGLTEAGLDPADSDTVIGTSAGALFGTRLRAGEPPAQLYARQLDGTDRIDLNVTAGQTLRFLFAALATRDSERSARRLGRAALRADTVTEAEVLDTVGRFLRDVREWPSGRLRLTAVDALTGKVRAFDSESGVPIVTAVAASCAVPLVWPPVAADSRRWQDGGTRSTAHLGLARGHRDALVVAPIPAAPGPHPDVHREAAALRASGTAVGLITPDKDSRRAMGRNLTDYRRQSEAARTGHRQATAAVPGLRDVLRI
ncbi:Patatin-like phospholipase [Streptomyces sp. YIM 130001]|uniref:patatin-like phospholipase family protein n=1 Tax=Streptomyces sp. YIM 130001 TaxID=2259644 RepID=UPI000E653D5E|nr:patatin-like phospholipase family protein [Streptomyces sp. YIM 130001]RII12405.1 Patatin-like phospholipase [Streptomyces sp. YIM 130001]